MRVTRYRQWLFSFLLALMALVTVAAVACKPKETSVPEGPETGNYYSDNSGVEYLLDLHDGNRFSFTVNADVKEGTYTVNGSELNFAFPEGELRAHMENDVITLTYNGVDLLFYRDFKIKVTFVTNGGGDIAAQTIRNGQKAARPEDPQYVGGGHLFLGWYSDSACTRLFDFDARLTADTTVYAKWVGENESEYTISFDAGYAAAQTPQSLQTKGGLLPDVPAIERSGYTFLGWWISMENRADRLSYVFTNDTVFHENTTLFALWQEENSSRLPSPAVSAREGALSWQAIPSASTYRVKIVDPDGNTAVEENVGGTTYPYDFAEAGDYMITVTAVASDPANNSEPAVRYYRSRGLYRVSIVRFDDAKREIAFLPVPNATKYSISVVCGDETHTHSDLDLNGATVYDFSSCAMREEGILFTIKAAAEGYVTSVSEQFVYERHLEKAENLRVEEETLMLTWDAVENAASYRVTIGGDSFDTQERAVPLKGYGKGTYDISVMPIAFGFNSPEATKMSYQKKSIATPSNLRLEVDKLVWDSVDGATGYRVRIGQTVYDTDKNELGIDGKIEFTDGQVSVSVCALEGTAETLYSDELVLRSTIAGTVRYSQNTLTWFSVPNARYEVRIDGNEVLSTNASSMDITLPHAGEVKLAVRFYVTEWSEWEEISVTAYTLTFDCRGGVGITPRYYAVGDLALLQDEAVYSGYDFVGWYDAAENGSKFEGGVTVTGNLTVYAYYSPKQYTVTTDDGFGNTAETKVTYRQAFELAPPAAENSTAAFDGWWSAANGGTRYTDSEGKSVAVWTVTADTTVYAHWIDLFSFELMTLPGTDTQVYAVSKGALFASGRDDLLAEYATVTVPATHLGIKVGAIRTDAFAGCRSILTMRIPDTMLLIFSNPFGDRYTNDTLQAIEVYHVEGNDQIRYTSYDGVLYDYGTLDDQVTYGKQLAIAYIPSGMTGDLEVMDGVTSIPTQIFDHSELTSITIPASVTRIAPQAFYTCRTLVSVTVLDPAEGEAVGLTIAENAFYDCDLLETVNLPARLEEISLRRYTLGAASGTPASQPLETTGEEITNSFYLCPMLKAVNVAEGGTVYSSEDGVLYNAAETELLYVPVRYEAENFIVPVGVTKIADGAFFFVTGVKNLEIAYSVSEIGEAAFYRTQLETVIFRGSDIVDGTTIGKYAFRESAVQNVQFEANSHVTTLEEGAFYGCTSLTEFVMPDSLYQIGVQAFRGCTALASITFGNSEEAVEFGEDAFYQSGLKKLIIPKTAEKLPSLAGLESLGEIEVDPASEFFTSRDSIIFNKQETELLFYPRNVGGEYTVPASVTKIGSGAFQNASITKIIIGAQVTEIGADAFNGAALTALEFTGTGGSSLDIGTGAFSRTAIASVTLPSYTKTVGERAFYTISALGSLTLNEGLTYLGDYAFAGTEDDYYEPGIRPQYTAVTIPASLTYLGRGAFLYAERLQTVTFGNGFSLDELPEEVFAGTAIVSVGIPASIVTIGGSAFAECVSLRDVTFADKCIVETIGEGAFSYCGSLASITIPASVTTIGAYAFSGYRSAPYQSVLKSIEFEESQLSLVIEGYAFQYTALEQLTLPARVTEIGENCFLNASLVSIDMSLTDIRFLPELLFQSCSDLAEVKLPKNLEYIGESAFINCSSLTTITLPATMRDTDGYDAIGEEAFKGTGLQKFLLEDGEYEGTFTIGDEAFYGSNYDGENSIEILELPATLSELSSDFFGEEENDWWTGRVTFTAFFTSLTTITVKGSAAGQRYVTEDGVLYNAEKTELIFCPPAKQGTLTLPDTLTDVAENAFKGCGEITVLVIPANWTTFDKSMFSDCTGLQNVEVAAGGSLQVDEKGVLFADGGKSLVYYPASRSEETYEVPATVTAIADNAFENVAQLKQITFASRTEDITIGRSAFANSGLTSFTFPKELTAIGDRAFSGCTSLKTVTAEDNCRLTALASRLFEDCTALESLEIPDHVVAIPDAEPEEGGSLEDEYDDKFSIIAGCTELSVITIKGNALKKIGIYGLYIDAYDFNLTTVNLPASVEEIGHHAFYHNEVLTCLGEAEYNLTTIGDAAFYYCTQLSQIRFGNALRSIGAEAFYYAALTEIVLPDTLSSIGDEAFYYSKLQKVTVSGGLTDMGESIFSRCSDLTTVILGEGLTAVGDWMFYGCGRLNSVTVPATLQTINEYAFYGCGLLTQIDLKNVREIGPYAFSGCGLTSLTLPQSVVTLGARVFENCSELVTVVMNAALSSLPDRAFSGCYQLAPFALPENLTSIGDYAFYGCYALTSVEFPASVISIGQYAFASSGLTGVTLPDNINSVGAHVFDGCASLTTIGLPEGLKEIGSYMFANTGLTAYVIPDHIETVGSYAFYGCEALASITIGAGVRTIGDYAFEGCALTSIEIPSGVETFGEGLFKDNALLTDITLPESFAAIGDYMFAGTGLTSYSIPEGVERIGAYAFAGCESLVTLVIPESVTAIGAHAFEGCAALVFTFPESVTEYGEYALAGVLFGSVTIPAGWTSIPAGIFKGNTALTSVQFAEGCVLTSIGASAFEGCSSLLAFDLTGITSIGENAFAGCTALSGIVLPESLTSLGGGAFKDCKSLTAITIPESLDVEELDFASIFEGCADLAFTFADDSYTVYYDVVYGADNAFLFFLPAAMTRDYVIIMPNADLTADSDIANTGLFGEYGSQRGVYTWIKYIILMPGVKIGDYCFEDWSSDRHIYFVGMEEPSDTPSGWGSSWESSCDAQIHWNVEFDPATDPLPWQEAETAMLPALIAGDKERFKSE